ncbi:MAG: hypothetical protein HKN21_07905 [Candidatus Eisenbacteria bacterium]|uniref:Dienelactone hydrolase domain-containing protein n=1 Tax=Eiseniibacteriota bacterium TaxID=2212470 RepID=A0A7Y2H2F6_UNCEI|nr:hypothetical protein [Candidatus Eisenbacteria bacterium]
MKNRLGMVLGIGIGVAGLLVQPGVGYGSAELSGPSFRHIDNEAMGEVTKVKVEFSTDQGARQGDLFLPPGNSPHAAVIFLHSGEGLTKTFKERCRELAEGGLVVFAPEYRTGIAGTRFEADPTEVACVLEADALLRQHPRVDKHQVGLIGSSHGSLVALLAVAEGDRRQFRCVAQASGNQGAIAKAGDIKIPVLVQHGAKDAVANMQDARFMGIEIKKTGNSSVTIKEYTLAGHDLWYLHKSNGSSEEQIAQGNWAWDDLNDFLGRYLTSGASLNAR